MLEYLVPIPSAFSFDSSPFPYPSVLIRHKLFHFNESRSKISTITNLEYHVLQVIAEGGTERVGCVRGGRSKDKAKGDWKRTHIERI